jgi:hypothetical protein
MSKYEKPVSAATEDGLDLSEEHESQGILSKVENQEIHFSDLDEDVDEGPTPDDQEHSEAPPIAPVVNNANSQKPDGSVIATPFRWINPIKIPRRQWLYGKHVIRGFVSVTASFGGIGKTALTTTEVLAFVTGHDLLDDKLRGRGRVWYLGLEDPIDEYQRRFAAAMLHFKIEPGEVAGRLFLDSGRNQKFVVAHEGRTGVEIIQPLVNSIIKNIIDNKIDVLIVDPFVSSHTLAESDNTKIHAVVGLWAEIAEKTNCGIDLVHHTRKGTGGGDEPTTDDLRGASAVPFAARSVRLLAPMGKNEAREAGVDNRKRFFRVVSGKANMDLKPDAGTWRQMISTPLGNGDGDEGDVVGVAAAWQRPDAHAGITEGDLLAVQRRIATGEWRESSQAKDWAGIAVAEALGLDHKDPVQKAKVKKLLKDWIAAGDLKVVQIKDEKGNLRPCIKPF